MLFDQITIVGVGLIGGSVGLAAKARAVTGRVVGVDRDAANIAKAIELGAIDSGTTDLAEGVSEAGLVVVCTPVDRIPEVIVAAAPDVPANALFTDAGSTKLNIVRALNANVALKARYVPAHPLAGAEKNGVLHARAELFTDRVTILTPEHADPEHVRTVAAYWQALGSRIVTMNAADHDRTLAITSHLPHAVASSVAGATDPELLPLTAGGFRDVTRIAAGDPRLWAAIFEANRDATLSALAVFTERLEQFRTLLETGDRAGLVQWLNEGKQVRDALGT